MFETIDKDLSEIDSKIIEIQMMQSSFSGNDEIAAALKYIESCQRLLRALKAKNYKQLSGNDLAQAAKETQSHRAILGQYLADKFIIDKDLLPKVVKLIEEKPWGRAALLLGTVYFLIGRAFAVPTNHVHAWRLAAWVVSGAAFAAHIGYEHYRLRHSPRLVAWHAALAVALGAFLLAVAATVHAVVVASHAPYWRFLLALVTWPVIAALPAFLVALIAGAVLPHLSRGT